MGWSYLQSYRYFFNNSKGYLGIFSELHKSSNGSLNRKNEISYELAKLFRINNSILHRSLEFIESIRFRYGNNSILVGVHIRRGLYFNIKHFINEFLLTFYLIGETRLRRVFDGQ